MTRKEITLEEYNKFKNCFVQTMYMNSPKKYKLVRKNKRWTRVASLYTNSDNNETSVLQLLYRNSEVKNFL